MGHHRPCLLILPPCQAPVVNHCLSARYARGIDLRRLLEDKKGGVFMLGLVCWLRRLLLGFCELGGGLWGLLCCWSLPCRSFWGWWLLLWVACFLLCSPVLLPFFVLRPLFFVRLPRPRFRGSCRGRWACVRASSLSAFRRRAFVWSVFPAVVFRFSGEVAFVWVLVSGVLPDDYDTERNCYHEQVIYA